MKNLKSLLIVSVLLCLVLSVFGCDIINKSDANTITDVPPVTITADPTMSNFLTFEYVEKDPLSVGTSLTEEYGTLVSSSSGNLLVFRKETKDYMNKATVTYTVFSVEENKVAATFTHEYEDEFFPRLDDFGNPVLPKNDMKVSVDTLNGYIDYIIVEKTTNTPIDEEIIEKNSLTHSYSTSYSYEFYDAHGTSIATSSVVHSGYAVEYTNSIVKASFGKTYALFDTDENKLISTYDGDTTSEYIEYDHSNDRYNYLFYSSYGNVDYGSPVGGRGRIEVYTKSGEPVCKYVYSDYSMTANTNVLANGDIMIQYVYLSDSIDCDIVMDDMKYDIQTLILDVETGKVTEVEFNYLVNRILDTDELAADSLEGGIKLTFNEQNVRNVAYATKLENRTAGNNGDIIFFDDLLNVNYVLDKVIPEQDLDGEYIPLADGYFLVSVINDVVEYAIVKDGQVTCYVPRSAHISDYAIITDNGVYNFDMKLIFDLTPEEYEYPEFTYPTEPPASAYEFECTLGKYVIFEAHDYELKISETEYEYKDFVLILNTTDGSTFLYEETEIVESDTGFVTLYDSNLDRYEVLNADLETILASKDYISIVYGGADKYIAYMTFNGNRYAYVLTYAQPESES